MCRVGDSVGWCGEAVKIFYNVEAYEVRWKEPPKQGMLKPINFKSGKECGVWGSFGRTMDTR